MKTTLALVFTSFTWFVAFGARTTKNACNSKRCNFRNEFHIREIPKRGMWNEQTHPKHYPGPMSSWSSLIGCSHSNNYHIWRHGDLASPGVQTVSELGSSWKLEKEMKNHRKKILSIIKAPGLWWGVGQSIPTEFKVDPLHNLFSSIARIIPSPDWFVGVDRLNLCNMNCTWKDEENINLFPMDAGTDDGINFVSVNSRSTPQQPIRPITKRLHDHPKASFYLPDNNVIRPFARIKIEKMAVHGSCPSFARKSPAPTRPARVDCQVSRWSSWTACSVTCGTGTQSRGRVAVIEAKHDGIECPPLYEHRSCFVHSCQGSSKCVLSAWSRWSRCIGTCGVGRKRRSRTVLFKPAHISRCPVKTKKRRCKLPPCQLADRMAGKVINCQVTVWSKWSTCNRPCRGKKKRSRFVIRKAKNGGKLCPQTREKRKCNRRKCPIG